MHVIDAGDGPACCEATPISVRYGCPRCNYETGWVGARTVSEAKSGQHCPICNAHALWIRQCNQLAAEHYAWVERMNWHQVPTIGALGLIASEVGEAFAECVGNKITDRFADELADIALRTLDIAHWNGIDIARALEEVAPAWKTLTPTERLGEISTELALWINSARKETIGTDFTQSMACVLWRVIDVAKGLKLDLMGAVRAKRQRNEVNGTRGRKL